MKNIVSYGISEDYLSHWGLEEAFREVLQNFMDYGDYKVDVYPELVTISNDFIPENLEFLSVGTSKKLPDKNNRGKYGEGLKMALLILIRSGYPCIIRTNDYDIHPIFVESKIGKVFAVDIQVKNSMDSTFPNPNFFSISIKMANTKLFKDYYDDIIKDQDILYDDKYFGRIVDREVGRLYCGGLFVCEVENLTRAYDINPRFLSLDRDRKTPATFDVNWACSKINESYGKLTVKDLSHSDHMYVTRIPDKLKENITPKIIGNSIYATYEEEGETKVIKNDKIHTLIKTDSFFKKMVHKFRRFIISQLGIYELLVQFRDKYLFGEEETAEFNSILELIKHKEDANEDNK